KMFDELMVNIKSEVCHNIFRSASSLLAFNQFLHNMPQRTEHQSTSAFGGSTTTASTGSSESRPSDMVSEANEAVAKAKPIRVGPKVGRNDPVPAAAARNTNSATAGNRLKQRWLGRKLLLAPRATLQWRDPFSRGATAQDFARPRPLRSH